MKSHAIHVALLAVGVCAASVSCAQTSYQFVDLGNGAAAGINDLGQVVGSSGLGATLWNGTVPTGLNFGTQGYATAINNAGQIVGATTYHDVAEAALWQGTTITSLTAPDGGLTYANAINGSGQVVGGTGSGAMQWKGADPTSLGIANGYSYAANGINNSGESVGSAFDYISGNTVATAWKGGNAIVLNSLGGTYSDAYAINNAGVIVGVSTSAANSNAYIATEWKGSSATALSSLGGGKSYAFAINNAGVIVGASTNAAGTSLATMWDSSSVVNLNSLLSPGVAQAGWVLTSATGINNEGWIVGDAVNSKTGASDAFELRVSPVPEAATLSMLLAGLGLIGLTGYFRKKCLGQGRHPLVWFLAARKNMRLRSSQQIVCAAGH